MKILPNLVLLATALSMSAATTRYVNLNNPNPVPPFTEWATAATNIQDAVDAAVAGDEVLVTNGVYSAGSRIVYQMSNRVAIRKAIAVRSVNGPAVTIIQGRMAIGATNGDGAIRCAYVGTNAVLIGFTLTNGHTHAGFDNREGSGGGVWCEPSGVVSICIMIGNTAALGGGGAYSGVLLDCTLSGNIALGGGGASGSTLCNCVVNGNSARDSGGGVLAANLSQCLVTSNFAVNAGGGAYSGTLSNCALFGNSAWYGGGFGGGTGGGSLHNCVLIGNSATSDGGGAFNATLNNCVVKSNSAPQGGATSYSTLNNCIISGNSASWGGGAHTCTLNNCTLLSNSATTSGGGAVGGTLNNCVAYYNLAPDGPNCSRATVNYSCTTPLLAGPGNIIDEPLFVNTNGWNDLRLQSNSPCINAGNNTYAPGATDLDGNPRIVGGTVDIGAYEFQSPASQLSYAWLQQYGLPTDGTADFTDQDGDRANNWQEWQSATIPTNALSALRLLTPQTVGTNLVVTWQSVTNKTYCLERSTALATNASFLPLASNLVGQAGTTTFTDTNAAPAGPRFYRVGVQ